MPLLGRADGRLAPRAAVLVCASLLGALGCDGGPVEPPLGDSGPAVGIARTAQINAYEGQPRFVTVLDSGTGESLEGATVMADDVFRIVAQRCAGTRGGVVLEVRDTRPNTGAAVPQPIDAQGHFLTVRPADGPDLRALVNVFPLDTISAGGGEPVRTGDVRLASGMNVTAGAMVIGDAPLRWIVFGDATLAGTLDVSALDATPGPGGHGPGEGPSAGAAGPDGAGGGGGGHATEGQSGAGPGGEPGEGGAGGAAAPRPGCATDFFASEPCAGSGGGGDGGAGGGAGALVVLGALDASGGGLRARGGDASADGGGGAGGAWWVTGDATGEVSGGAGAGLGGAGGEGLVQTDLAIAVAGLELLTSSPDWQLTGLAPAGATVFVEREDDGTRVEAAADASGAFTASVTLLPGLNRYRVFWSEGGDELRSWVGTSVEQVRREAQVLPVGGLIDVAFLP